MRSIKRYAKKLKVYSFYLDNSFDQRDRKRLKPITRLRQNESEIEKEKSGDISQRLRDWYSDIDRGYSK